MGGPARRAGPKLGPMAQPVQKRARAGPGRGPRAFWRGLTTTTTYQNISR